MRVCATAQRGVCELLGCREQRLARRSWAEPTANGARPAICDPDGAAVSPSGRKREEQQPETRRPVCTKINFTVMCSAHRDSVVPWPPVLLTGQRKKSDQEEQSPQQHSSVSPTSVRSWI